MMLDDLEWPKRNLAEKIVLWVPQNDFFRKIAFRPFKVTQGH